MDQAPELSRRQTLVGGLTLATGLTAYSASASAQTYPDRPVKAIVPYSPGSGADVTARLTLGYLATELKQSVVIENRPGAGAIAGTQAVAQAAPNGYTILFCATQHAINPSAQESLPYDTQKDFIAVARVTTQPLFLAVPASLPVNSVAELIAFLKASPGKYNYGSTGLGTSIHLAGAYFAAQAGLSMTHVPYKDAGQCIMDLARGEYQVIFYTYQPLEAQLAEKKIKLLGSTGNARSSWAPAIPTMEEAGMKGFVMPAWHGVFLPANTPEPIVKTLELALAKVAADPAYRASLLPTGTDVFFATSKDFGDFVASEIIRFAAITAQNK